MTRSVVYGSSVVLDAGGNKWTNLANGVSSSDAATVGQIAGGAPVSSVFGRTGAVIAVTGDYYGAVAAALTGATQASRYVGATASGAPASGTFVKGDWVVAQDGAIFVCTTGGTPGTWLQVGAAPSFATPSVVFGSSAAGGAASTVIRSDSTIAAFDATTPAAETFGASGAVGSAAFAARRDHVHAMPATPVTSFAKSGGSALTGAVTISEGTGVTLTPSGNDIAIASSTGGLGSDGWASTAVSLTYSSVDGATGVATTGSDLSGTIPVGARLKFTQTTVKYFIVTAIDATTITFWGGTDYTLANAAISAVSWSVAKVPFGFNADPAKWTVSVTNTSNNSQSSPTNGTWYNPGTISISVPIGCWFLSYEAAIGANRTSTGNAAVKATMSTANNSESDTSMSMIVLVIVSVNTGDITQVFPIISVHKGRTLTVATKTSYFLNVSPTTTGLSSVDIRGDVSPATIRAICAYL